MPTEQREWTRRGIVAGVWQAATDSANIGTPAARRSEKEGRERGMGVNHALEVREKERAVATTIRHTTRLAALLSAISALRLALRFSFLRLDLYRSLLLYASLFLWFGSLV